jgi:outer membrane protein TolC
MKKQVLVKYLLIILTLCFVASAQNGALAEEPPAVIIIDEEENQTKATKLDLFKALDIALNQNRSILQAQEDNIIYKLQAKQNFTTLLPTIQASNDYQFNSVLKQLSIPGFPAESTPHIHNQNQTIVGLSQPVTNLYENSLLHKISKETYKISLLQTTLQKEFVINDVSGQYFDILKQYRIIELNKQNILALEEYYKVALDRYEAGDALERDALKIKIEIDNAKHDLLTEQNKLQVQLYRLKDSLNIDLEEELDVITFYAENEMLDVPFDEMKSIAIENRPEVQQLIRSVKIAKLNKKYSFAQYIPDVQFFANYVHNYGEGFVPDNNFVFGINGQYTLWDWGKRRFNVKEQKAQIRKQELDLKDQINQIYIDVKTDLNGVEEAQDLINVSKNNLGLAEESLRITKNRYDVGLAIVLDLLDDQTNLLEAQVNLATSELDYQKSLVNLKKTLGILYP